MDTVNHSAVHTTRKSKLAQTFSKALLKRIQKIKFLENTKKDSKNTKISSFANGEAFISKLFANISTVKAAYSQLQVAQFPYDADEIQSSDQIIISELNNLSELKQRYANKKSNEISPQKTLLLSEIQELNGLLVTYRITTKKLDSQLKLKDSEIIFLKEKLSEADSENELLEKRLNLSGDLALPEITKLSGLRPSHFIAYFKQAIKSIRSFVRLLISEMEFADWDLELAASSIQPGVFFRKKSDHICYAIESFVCRDMFDGFNYPNFSIQTGHKKHRRVFFDRLMELKSVRPEDYLAWKGKSEFAEFCRDKYLRIMRPKMEKSIFGSLEQRNLVSLGEFPETPFFLAFCEMAKDIWLLHCLSLSFDPESFIFQVGKNSRFSEVYMESLNDEAFLASCDADVRVAFTVVPGFVICKTVVVQCQVYLG